MLPEAILFAMASVFLLAGSYSDIKTREVPDLLSYGLIAAALGLRLLYSFAAWDWSIILSGIAGFVIFVAVAYMLYYTGQWGGGDSKLLMGMGAVIGLDVQYTLIPVLLIFFIVLICVGGLYGLGWVCVLAVRKKSEVMGEARALLRNARGVQWTILAVSCAGIASALLLTADRLILLLAGAAAFAAVGGFYLWVLTRSVEKVAFFKKVHPNDLTEGDWIVNDIFVDGKRIAGPRDLGIERHQIAQLAHYHRIGKLDKVLIKEGIPFVPSFLLAFIVTLAAGDWIVSLL